VIGFEGWPKTPRLFRDMIVTEKIDGTNAAVLIVPWSVAVAESSQSFNWTEGYFREWHPAGKNLITVVGTPNRKAFNDLHWTEYGPDAFAVFAQSRKRLITPDQDNYGFATWVRDNAAHLVEILGEGRHYGEWWGQGIQRGYGLDHKRFSLFNVKRYFPLLQAAASEDNLLPNLNLVPILYEGRFDTKTVGLVLGGLAAGGSHAAPGFDRPEGVIVYHHALNGVFKATRDNDDEPKGHCS